VCAVETSNCCPQIDIHSQGGKGFIRLYFLASSFLGGMRGKHSQMFIWPQQGLSVCLSSDHPDISETGCEQYSAQQLSSSLCSLMNQLQKYVYEHKWNTRWFKYDRDKLWLVYTQIVPVIFEPPWTSCVLTCCIFKRLKSPIDISWKDSFHNRWNSEVCDCELGSWVCAYNVIEINYGLIMIVHCLVSRSCTGSLS
jgi:hypothetical protein